MEEIDKNQLIKHIKLGTNEVLYYPYNNGREPLPLRPITSSEMDDSFYKSLKYAPTKIAGLVIKFKLKFIEPNRDIDVSDDGYAELQKFYNSIDYWIVYHAMKDFQDEEFKFPDFNKEECHPKGYYEIYDKMNEVHKIAKFVLEASHQPEEVIKEIFKDEYGREIAYCVHYLNIPLTEISKMTKLQRDYLVYSKLNLNKITEGKKKESKYVMSGKKMTYGEFLERFK